MDRNLIQRLITGTLFVGVLVFAIWWHSWSYAALFLIITVSGLFEFYRLIGLTGASPQVFTGVVTAIALYAGVYGLYEFTYELQLALPLALLLMFVIFIVELFRGSAAPFQNIGTTILGVIYVALPFALWHTASFDMLNNINTGKLETYYNYRYMLGFFIILWTSDSLAYVCGRLFGKRKLYERISPKKTWEGFIGGVVFTIAASWLVGEYIGGLQHLHWMVIGGIVAITGTLGDLVESMFKRSIGVKDSGTLLPGHGGILDRFDAVLISSPFVVMYILAVQR
ncbi:MAG: phosphatidate cytidylyltransferase [Bacteroidetes bacterium]|jgi:phosphatidate cytidylyltransferase|nr:phosphatidate cytidylyltransferase [Bacteroidota bacterium]